MAHPPGKDTLAWPKRASNGPKAKHRGAHGFDQLVGRFGVCSSHPHQTTVPLSLRSALTPMLRINLNMVLTSCRRGTLCKRHHGSAVNSARTTRARPRFWHPQSHLTVELLAAANQNLSMLCLCFMPQRQACAFHSAGVKVFIDKACTSSVLPFCRPRWHTPFGGVESNASLQIRPTPRWHTNGGHRPRHAQCSQGKFAPIMV